MQKSIFALLLLKYQIMFQFLPGSNTDQKTWASMYEDSDLNSKTIYTYHGHAFKKGFQFFCGREE